MSNYISGSSSKIGAHKEASFDYVASPLTSRQTSTALRMTSESLQATYNKLDEGVLMASKTQPEQELGSVSVSGDVDTVLHPSFVGWLMEVGLGTKTHSADATVGTENVGTNPRNAVMEEDIYTLADVNEDLPSSGVELWRGDEGFYYSGMTVSTLSIEAPAQDFVKANISFAGTRETYIGQQGEDSAEPQPKITAASTDGSYKCTKAKLYPATAGSDDLDTNFNFDFEVCPSDKVYDVETSTLTFDNGIEAVPATYCSGLYANQPSHGQRSVTLACNVPYSNSFETFRQTYYAQENPDKLALALGFASKETFTYIPTGEESPETIPMHQVFVVLPNVSISNISANASGDGLIDGSFTGTALSIGATEPVKVYVRNYKFVAGE